MTLLPPRSAEELFELLRRHRFNITTEAELQQAVQRILDEHGLVYDREARIIGGRIDFLVRLCEPRGSLSTDPPPQHRVGIELKTGGSRSALIRQLWRYARGGEVDALLVVTTRRSHDVPETMQEIPVRRIIAPLWGAL